ncbi:MAG: hypothetical protein AB7E42_09035 [Anaerotignaceae bacterium]
MKGKKSSMKRHGAAVLAIVIVLAMILSVVAPVIGSIAYGAPISTSTTVTVSESEAQVSLSKMPKEVDDGQFEITASIGFDSKYIVGKSTPFKFIVTNNGSDFKGELQMKVYLFESSERYSSQYAIFYIPIELSKNATKEVEMTAQVASITTFFTASLVDEKDNVICVKNFNATAKDPSTVWTGVLSDSPAELVYIKQNDSYYNQQTAYYGADGVEYFDTIYLDSKTLPNDSSVLNNFRMLIINDFNTENLSQEQKDAIAQWVNEGGMLILGTGASAKKVLSGLGNTTNFTVSDEATNVSLENIGQILVQDVSNLGGITVSDAQMKDASSLLEVDGRVITSSAKIGNGNVILHSFDLGKAPIPEVGEIEVLLRTIYESENPNIFNLSYVDDKYGYNPVSDRAGRMAPEKGSMMNIIFIIIGVYVVFVGPILYIVLKKKDKRERGWVIIPIVAMAITVVIYVAGGNSYYRSSIINLASEVTIENGKNYAQAQIYGGLRSGEKGSLEFTADEDFDIDVSEIDYGERYGDEEVCALKINTDSKSEITYYGKASWDLNTFATEKTIDMGGALEANIGLKGDTLVGSITNNTNFDFEDIVLHVGTVYNKIDSCMSGETVEVNYKIESLDLQNGNYYNSYEELQKLFGVEDGYYNFGGDSEEYFIKYGRASMLGDIDDTQETKTTSADEPMLMKLYAFNKEPLIEGNKYINGKKMNETAENFFVMNVPVGLEDGAEFDLPYGLIGPSSIVDENGNSVGGDTNYIYMYPAGNAYCEFMLPQNVNLELFQIRWNRTSPMTTEPEILNVITGEWEELTQEEITDLQSYADEDGNVTLRAHVEEDGEIEVPQIRLKGGKQ